MCLRRWCGWEVCGREFDDCSVARASGTRYSHTVLRKEEFLTGLGVSEAIEVWLVEAREENG